MATIKRSNIEVVADGRKVAKVQFTPQVPNPAAQSDVEVVFEVQKSNSVHFNHEGTPFAVIGPLSCTLVDTREPYTLSKDQRQVVIQAALDAAAEAEEIDW